MNIAEMLEGICHENFFVRNTCLDLVSKKIEGKSSVSAAKNFLDSLDNYGVSEAFEYVHMAGGFLLDDSCAERLLDKLEADSIVENDAWHMQLWLADQANVEFLVRLRDRWSKIDRAQLEMRSSIQAQDPWAVADRRIELSQMTGDEVVRLLEDSVKSCNEFYLEHEDFPRYMMNDIELMVGRLETEFCLSNELVKQWLNTDQNNIGVPDGTGFWQVGVAILIAKKRRLVELADDVIKWLKVDSDWYNDLVANFISDCNDLSTAERILRGFGESNKGWAQLFISGAIEDMTPYPELEDYLVGAIKSAYDSYIAINLISYLAQIGTESSIALAERMYFDYKNDPESGVLRELFLCHYVLNEGNPAKVQKYQREVEADYKKFLKLKEGMNTFDFADHHVPEIPDFDYQPHETVVRAEPKVGRNQPCPCGSGKKYKKCCL